MQFLNGGYCNLLTDLKDLCESSFGFRLTLLMLELTIFDSWIVVSDLF